MTEYIIPHIEVYGGLTSRLYVLAIVKQLCPQANIYWTASNGIKCRFDEIFKNEDIVTKSYKSGGIHNLYYYGTPINELPHTAILVNRFTNDAHTQRAHTDERLSKALKDTNGYLYIDQPIVHLGVTPEDGHLAFYNLINSLKLHDDLNNLLLKYSQYFLGKTVFGINIRNCPKGHVNHYLYKNVIPNISKIESDLVFVSCCVIDKDIIDMKERYPDRIILIEEDDYPLDYGESRNGVGRAMVEWLLLTRTDAILKPMAGFAQKANIYKNIQRENLNAKTL